MYYEEYFSFSQSPFSISPDPRFLYLTAQHREALAHLVHGISSHNGFVLLTGDVGVGKTTLCRSLLKQLPDNTDVAYVLNPKLEADEFLATLCDELSIEHDADKGGLRYYTGVISAYLLDAHALGRNTVLLIDEAQCLSEDLIETVRLLTNLETDEKKLLQIILVGQPQLRELLTAPSMEQVSQRITARFHLGPLAREDVHDYIRYRLEMAEGAQDIFTRGAIKRIYTFSKGVPRLINIICDRALAGAFVIGQKRVTARIVSKAAAEVIDPEKLPNTNWLPFPRLVASCAVLLMLCLLLALGWMNWGGDIALPGVEPGSVIESIGELFRSSPLGPETTLE